MAVWPPPHVVEQLGSLPRPPVEGVRWTTPDQWHVTLRFLGTVPDPGVVVAALGAGPLPRAAATMGPGTECLGPAVLSLPVAGLDMLARTVVAATAGIGKPPENRPFRGHLTLARSRPSAPRRVLRGLAPVEVTATWPVEEVTVVSSTLGGAGSRYEILARTAIG